MAWAFPPEISQHLFEAAPGLNKAARYGARACPLSREISRAHGGSLRWDASLRGGGALRARSTLTPRGPKSVTAGTVYVVEDDAGMRDAVGCLLLRNADFDVRLAHFKRKSRFWAT